MTLDFLLARKERTPLTLAGLQQESTPTEQLFENATTTEQHSMDSVKPAVCRSPLQRSPHSNLSFPLSTTTTIPTTAASARVGQQMTINHASQRVKIHVFSKITEADHSHPQPQENATAAEKRKPPKLLHVTVTPYETTQTIPSINLLARHQRTAPFPRQHSDGSNKSSQPQRKKQPTPLPSKKHHSNPNSHQP